MRSFDARRLTRDGLLALFSGLSLAACDKSAPDVAPERRAASAPNAPAAAAAVKPAASAAVDAKEVPSAMPAASGSGKAEMACAPGGCAPGACGANKK